MKKKIALYARVSTNNGQNPEAQLLDLRKFVNGRGFEIYKEYVDKGISGAKDSRPALNELMNDAKKRRFDAVAVWKFDRFGRSTKHLIQSLELFHSLKIDFISFQENVDTSTSMGKLVFEVMAALAEFERSLIRERVFSGLRRAKAKGTKLGRPKVDIDLTRAKELQDNGYSLRKIAIKMNTSPASISRLLRNKGVSKTLEKVSL
tara:strand:+ start:73 stop:687 length:615 start_codon:yes stop_codon:yes gene_type:complete